MATYAIGDLQGCFKSFLELLDQIHFDPKLDRLWLVGDLVNRGPNSLELLRFIKQMDEVNHCVIITLGNHDLHLLMVAGKVSQQHSSDTFQSLLDAPDCEDLLYWLRHQRLFYHEDNFAMVHAGLLPSWTIPQAAQLAQEVECILQQDDYSQQSIQLYGNEPRVWQEKWTGFERFRVIVNAMTRMRVCTLDGGMNLSFKGDLQSIPRDHLPWFDLPNRASNQYTIICGHWSALGLYQRKDLIALDSGCVWGRQLSAIRLEDRKLFQVACNERATLAFPQ
ncbi:bis(5'nucleosyl)-tetraphosphatase, ApaH [Nitrosomonas sp. PY1]|uniref:symmetrical bis(5'-nucleosyl)-tetraphosphatase n=1 Tax=Nitrosomonas sp. PY1 TaxID=1803906 RepID=UPI001FC7BCB8|nr:symmetrical bis(5'-nucleosyl)-tetraphosphatase [Nitrosomonas sp. PY1]GKS69167.1 bis(5'nucleosyl)-tetraphosphatase, ApaH [Nitrosomonas sp. PY1]